MDAIFSLVSEQIVGLVVGAILVGGPIAIRFALLAAKEAASKTPSKLDDEIVEKLLQAAEAKGRREALEERDG